VWGGGKGKSGDSVSLEEELWTGIITVGGGPLRGAPGLRCPL